MFNLVYDNYLGDLNMSVRDFRNVGGIHSFRETVDFFKRKKKEKIKNFEDMGEKDAIGWKRYWVHLVWFIQHCVLRSLRPTSVIQPIVFYIFISFIICFFFLFFYFFHIRKLEDKNIIISINPQNTHG